MEKLWTAREESIRALDAELRQEARVIHAGFSIIDSCIDRFEEVIAENDFCTVSGCILVKARYLALGVFSLCLDGLSQEAGALQRPFIEIIEQLRWFREDPARVKRANRSQMPRAGDIAKEVSGPFYELRSHLNVTASHFKFALESVDHLVDWERPGWRKEPRYSREDLKSSMLSLVISLLYLAVEGASCLATAQIHKGDIADKVEAFRERGCRCFKILGVRRFRPPERYY